MGRETLKVASVHITETEKTEKLAFVLAPLY